MTCSVGTAPSPSTVSDRVDCGPIGLPLRVSRARTGSTGVKPPFGRVASNQPFRSTTTWVDEVSSL